MGVRYHVIFVIQATGIYDSGDRYCVIQVFCDIGDRYWCWPAVKDTLHQTCR